MAQHDKPTPPRIQALVVFGSVGYDRLVQRRDRDIHKIDNVLIATGKVAVVLAIFGVLMMIGVAVEPDDDHAVNAFVVLLGLVLVAAPIVLLGIGTSLRRREDRMIAVWTILERNLEVSVRELSINTGYSREFILDVVRVLNRRGLAYFVFDEASDTIVDGRLRSQVVIAQRCPHCHAEANQSVSLDRAADARCLYCGMAFDAAYVSQLKLQVLDSLRAQPPAAAEPPPGGAAFSVPTFVLLMVIFWPLGVFYALSRSGGVRGLRLGG
jgi:hypothetical protein